MVTILPSIIAVDQKELEQKVKALEPYVEKVSIDIMDGLFVPDKTVSLTEVLNLVTSVRYQLHLMVKTPAASLNRWLGSKAEDILVHAEADSVANILDALEKIKANGVKAGIVINPGTNYVDIMGLVAAADIVQFMTVEPGRYGAGFLPDVVTKIKQFHEDYPDKTILADGGINPQTAKLLTNAGVSILIVGSYIQDSSNIKNALEELNV